ncbi:Mediator of RNA polymerase II transcription subunit 12-like protein [Varanus komodoensis]|nr:Mediator of RNA polymerase II transcription subunit 12-like protein [Varanus komodoensis]
MGLNSLGDAMMRCGEVEVLDEKESISSASLTGSSLPVFQNVLLRFLDTQAPSLSDPNSEYEKIEFVNLVLLFCEFIRHDVFSHDAYMCTLISRGDLSVTAASRARSPTGENMEERYAREQDVKLEEHSIMEHMYIDSGTTNIFDDVDKNDFKTDFGSEFPIFSPMPGESCENLNSISILDRRITMNNEKSTKREKGRELIFPSNYNLLRHLQYATHFPIPLVSSHFSSLKKGLFERAVCGYSFALAQCIRDPNNMSSLITRQLEIRTMAEQFRNITEHMKLVNRCQSLPTSVLKSIQPTVGDSLISLIGIAMFGTMKKRTNVHTTTDIILAKPGSWMR